MTKKYKQLARYKISQFIINTVEKIQLILISNENKSFYFPRFTNRVNKNARCMVGWMVEIYKDQLTYDGEIVVCRNSIDRVFQPVQIGMPISMKVWTALTIHSTQKDINLPNLPRLATFEEVKTHWLKVATLFQQGLLDSEILTPQHLQQMKSYIPN